MQEIRGLAIFFLISQLIAGLLLLIAYQVDEASFDQLKIKGRRSIPGLRKAAELFRITDHRGARIMYLFSMIFVIFSYAALILTAFQVFDVFF